MDYGEAALTAHPLSIEGFDARVVQHGSFVQQDTLFMNVTGERDLVRMEVVKA